MSSTADTDLLITQSTLPLSALAIDNCRIHEATRLAYWIDVCRGTICSWDYYPVYTSLELIRRNEMHVFFQLIILRLHRHFTRNVRKKNPQNHPHFTFENPQIRILPEADCVKERGRTWTMIIRQPSAGQTPGWPIIRLPTAPAPPYARSDAWLSTSVLHSKHGRC